MFGIFKRYKRLIGKGAAESFNRIAAFLTNLCTNESLNFDRPDDPSGDNPPCLSVNEGWLAAKVKPTNPSSTSTLVSGFSGIISDHSKKGGTFTAGAAGGVGVKVKLLCRGMDDGMNGTLFWREFTITSDGRIYAIAAEDDAMGVYTDQ